MTILNSREREFENRFAYDEEIKFKVAARRNRLVGLWAAKELGLEGRAADAYAHEMVELLFHPGGSGHIVERLASDLEAAGKSSGAERIQHELDQCEKEAKRQLMGAASA
ncbi:MAG TPA: DUF1476 domain-containing protein [Aliidongia sp.]|nr:DUF1476 domain-containing protein [Aliidongia sp.]